MIAGRAGPFLETRAVLNRSRLLPVAGEVLVEVGDRTETDTVVARAPGRGVLHTVNAARQLDILPREVPAAMLVAVGDRVTVGQTLARTRGIFGFFAARSLAPVDAVVSAVSSHTGRILLEEPAAPLEVRAFLPGVVTAVHPGRGVTVSGWAARVAGVFGVGGERGGPLRAMVGRPDAVLDASQLDAGIAGCVLLGGALVTADALERAAALGAAGVIAGGVHDGDLERWLGRETVLADTTGVPAPLTLVITGGFGRVPLDPDAFELLRSHAGRHVCLTGHTRVRAGSIRPEAIVPLSEQSAAAPAASAVPQLAIGSRVLVVRAPWFAHRGRVGRLPETLETVESGARCLVADVDLDVGETVRVPRCNLEVLSGP